MEFAADQRPRSQTNGALLVEDVTLIQTTPLLAHVRFKGGAHRSLSSSGRSRLAVLRQTRPEIGGIRSLVD